ncbi:MAG: glycosyltransferase family 2 protein, partial [Dermabacter sp.]|nr:glycosyltransferase family 2 protein [Dermabacter sp.]
SISIEQNRMAHASEIVSEIGRNDLTYAEYPVHILYTDYSKSKGQPLLNAINIVTDLLFK